MSAANHVLTALDTRDCRPRGVKPDEWMSRCPAHDDRTPSLSITRVDGKVLLHCFAGCTTDEVLGNLGLELRDLYDDDPAVPTTGHTNGMPDYHGKPIITSYDYHDENGRVLYRVGRTAAKDFPVFHPDGNGGWAWGLNGARRVLYRLPEVLAAVERGDPVFLTEGEKDADSLKSAGVTATTNPGGAKKCKPDYLAPLRGAAVIVVPDRDEPGQAHAEQVVEALQGIASSVEVREPAEGKDVSDHLAAGLSVDQLRTSRRREISPTEPPPDGLVALDASSVAPEKVSWLWPGRVALGTLTLLVGNPGLGKSLLTCDLAASVSRDGDGVLMVTAEDALGAVVRPRLEAAGAQLGHIGFLQMRHDGLLEGITLPEDVPAVEQEVRRRGARLVVIDPLTAHLHESVNSWSDQSVRRALAPLHRLAEATGCAIVVVAHLNKSGVSDPLVRSGGSVGIPAAARSALLFATDPEDPEGERGSSRVLAHFKCNLAPLATSLRYSIESSTIHDGIETARVRCLGECDHQGHELLSMPSGDDRSERDEAKEFLRDELADGPRQAKELFSAARDAGISEKTLKRAKNDLGIKSEKDEFEGPWKWSLPAAIEGGHGGVAPFGEREGWPSSVKPAPQAGSRGVGQLENPRRGPIKEIDPLGAEMELERLQEKWGDVS